MIKEISLGKILEQFNLTSGLMENAIGELRTFNRMAEEVYGFNYQDYNIERIIDSIDSGGGGLTWDEFHRIMTEQKKKIEEGRSRKVEEVYKTLGEAWGHCPDDGTAEKIIEAAVKLCDLNGDIDKLEANFKDASLFYKDRR